MNIEMELGPRPRTAIDIPFPSISFDLQLHPAPPSD